MDCIELSPGQFDPHGEAYVLCYVGVIATVVFYSKPYRLCQSPSPGGEGGPAKPGRMRASLKGPTALVIDAPTPRVADFRRPQAAEQNKIIFFPASPVKKFFSAASVPAGRAQSAAIPQIYTFSLI